MFEYTQDFIGAVCRTLDEVCDQYAWNAEAPDPTRLFVYGVKRNVPEGGRPVILLITNTNTIAHTIRGCYPQDRQHHTHTASEYDKKTLQAFTEYTNATITKTPEQVARQIASRLLPDWLKLHELACGRIEEWQQYEGKTQGTLEELYQTSKKANGTHVLSKSGNAASKDRLSIRISDAAGGCYGDIRCFGDRCDIDLRSVSADLAKQIVALLRG